MKSDIKSILQSSTLYLKTAGIENARLDAEVLLAYCLNVSRLQLLLQSERELSGDELSKYQALLGRRSTFEPIAYIVGYKEFWGREFAVSPATLIPRPETETLIEVILEKSKGLDMDNLSIADLGTGTGCIGITLALELPHAEIIAVDISDEALKVAHNNAKRHMLPANQRQIKSSWFQALNPDFKFDIIASNPPYIDPSDFLMKDVALFEPHTALFSEEKGLRSYREIAAQADKFLKPKGIIVLEIGAGQEKEVEQVFSIQDFMLDKSYRDLNGIIRALIFRKTIAYANTPSNNN